MKKLLLAVNAFFDRLYRRPAGRLLLSLLMVLAVFFLAFLRMEPAYLVNDDTNIAFALAGCRTGTPFAAHPFIHVVLGFAVSRLYILLPSLPWWFLVQEAAIFLSALVLSMCVLRVCARRNIHWLAASALFGILFVGLLFRPIVRVTFTLTAAALGTAAVALLLSFDRSEKKATRTLLCVFSSLFLLAAFLFRSSSGLSVACFYFAAVLYRFADAHFFGKAERKILKRRIAAFASIMLALVLGTVGVGRAALTAYNEEGYEAFDNARADFVDYRLCDPYSANPELYASVGWDEPLYQLALHWCFMDERVTTESLTTIRDSSRAANRPLSEKISDIPARIRTFFSNDYFARLMLALPLAALLGAIALFALSGRRNPLSFFFALCILLGAALLIGYLAHCNRLILRTFRLVLMPACFSSALFALRILPEAEKPAPDAERTAKPSWRILASYGLCALLLLFAGLQSGRALMDTLRSDYTDEIAACRAVIDYCTAHPSEIFIRDTETCSNLDAVSTYPGENFANLLSWGDTDMLTGVQSAQLYYLGLDRLTMDVFRQENVRYLGTEGTGALRAFDTYLAEDLGARLEKVDSVTDTVGVYRVQFGSVAP